jgi:hypothetical protein
MREAEQQFNCDELAGDGSNEQNHLGDGLEIACERIYGSVSLDLRIDLTTTLIFVLVSFSVANYLEQLYQLEMQPTSAKIADVMAAKDSANFCITFFIPIILITIDQATSFHKDLRVIARSPDDLLLLLIKLVIDSRGTSSFTKIVSTAGVAGPLWLIGHGIMKKLMEFLHETLLDGKIKTARKQITKLEEKYEEKRDWETGWQTINFSLNILERRGRNPERRGRGSSREKYTLRLRTLDDKRLSDVIHAVQGQHRFKEAFFASTVKPENPFISLGDDDKDFSRIMNAVQNTISSMFAAGHLIDDQVASNHSVLGQFEIYLIRLIDACLTCHPNAYREETWRLRPTSSGSRQKRTGKNPSATVVRPACCSSKKTRWRTCPKLKRAIVSSSPTTCSTLIDCSTCGVLRSTGKRTSKLSPIRKEKSPVQRKERTAHFTVAA